MIFMRLKILPIGLFFLFSLIFLFPKTFSYYLDFTANTSVMPNQNITISGGLSSILPVGQVSTTTYALVIILIIVAVVTFWIYRRKA